MEVELRAVEDADRAVRQPVVGYWIGREHWGRGIATRALASFLREVTARPLYATVALRNTASVRVLEKCGFTLAGEVEEAGERVLELVLEREPEGSP